MKKIHRLLCKSLSFTHFFAIVLCLKVILVLIIGFHYEQDTPRYLLNIRHLYNPPLYSIILRLITTIYANLYFVIIAQTVIFSLIITYFSMKINKNYMLWALFWALEPFSTFYCSDLMSEWLFIALLFACYSKYHNFYSNPNYINTVNLALGIFALFMTRYVGFTFLIFFVLNDLFKNIYYRNFQRLRFTFFLIIFFLICTIPIRVVNYFTFKTWAVNAYDGLNLWNSVSVLYPHSNIRIQPITDFEKFLTTFPDSVFSTQNALMTQQMWNDNLPALTYAQQKNLSPIEMNTILKKISYQLLIQEPWIDYLQKFVLPNFMKPFLIKEETIGIQHTYFYLQAFFGKHHLPNFNYQYEVIIALYLILITNFLLQKNHFMNNYLLFYVISIIFTSAFFMRYGYVIMPLALMSLIEIGKKKFSLSFRKIIWS